MKNYNYDFVLPFFTATDELRPAMQCIHKDPDGFLYASDGHILIRVPADKVSSKYAEIKDYPKAGRLLTEAIERPHNTSCTVKVDDLIAVLAKAKWYRGMDGEECPDCKGAGDIECPACGHTHDCKACNGSGETNRKVKEFALLEDEKNYIIRIGTHYFKAQLLHTIAIVSKVAGFNTLELIISSKDNCSSALFKFDDVVIMLMPCHCDEEFAVLKTKFISND
ncbi:MAG: hypothetical protein ACRCZB_06055 [Bacteroidales bacterium]